VTKLKKADCEMSLGFILNNKKDVIARENVSCYRPKAAQHEESLYALLFISSLEYFGMIFIIVM
jgi:hypothetical protein